MLADPFPISSCLSRLLTASSIRTTHRRWGQCAGQSCAKVRGRCTLFGATNPLIPSMSKFWAESFAEFPFGAHHTTQGGPGSVTVWGWNGSSGSSFRFWRFLCKRVFLCVSVEFNRKGRFRFRFRFLENGSGSRLGSDLHGVAAVTHLEYKHRAGWRVALQQGCHGITL